MTATLWSMEVTLSVVVGRMWGWGRPQKRKCKQVLIRKGFIR